MTEYFNARQISAQYYDNYVLPTYLRTVLPEDTNARILDFGCGFGQTMFGLQKLGFHNLVGYDINEVALDYLRGKNMKILDNSNLYQHFNKQYRIILMNHVLEHLPKHEIIDTLTKIRNDLLSSDGELIITVPNAQSYTGCYWAYEDFTHNTLFTAGSLIYVLKMAGFTKINFIDRQCLEGKSWSKKLFTKLFIRFYELKNKFWMKVTDSHYHQPSPKIYSYELKVMASN